MPQDFFAAELSGEQPLSLETAHTLCGLAERFYSLQLWRRLHEDDLVFVREASWPEPHVCSVMGALGEVFALTAYLGSDGYHFFQALTQQLNEDRTAVQESFFGEQSSVYVHYVPRAELTKPDRDLLRATGYPAVRAAPVPMFRAMRPGYYPWYQTEGEARILTACLQAMLWFADRLSPDCWRRQGMYPLLSPDATGYSLTSQQAPAPVPEKAPLDKQRIQDLRRRRLPVGAAWQMELFCVPGMVGKKNERKLCLRLALAVDAETGIVLPTAFAEPQARTGQVLSDSLLGAIAAAGCLPSAVQVRDPRHALLLRPTARQLGFPVVLLDSLPELNQAKAALFQFLGKRPTTAAPEA